MKILFIKNNVLYLEDKEYFVSKETGMFFQRISDLGNVVSLFQISEIRGEKDTFSNYSVTNDYFKLNTVFRNKEGGKLHRYFIFYKAFLLGISSIKKNDFVYLFYPGPICKVIALLCVFFKKPFGLYVRGEQEISDRVSRFLYKKAHCVLTISPQFTKMISDYSSRVSTIKPMISFNEDDFFENREFTLKKEVNLLYVGRIVKDKGIFELYDAFKALRETYINLTLTLVGNGEEYDVLNNMIIVDGFQGCVRMLGMIKEKETLKKIYMKSDIFILPTYHEGFPRVLYEAMIMNIPIVTTFVGSIGYLMKDNVNCINIDPKSMKDIIDSVELLIKDESLRRKVGIGGMNTIKMYLYNNNLDHSSLLYENLKLL